MDCSAVALTNHCQNYTSFLLEARCSKWPRSFFHSCLSKTILHLHNLFFLSKPVVPMLLTPRWVNRRNDVKYFSINISKLTARVKHSISGRTAFRNPNLVQEATCFSLSDCNGTRTHNRLVRKRTLNHWAKLAK